MYGCPGCGAGLRFDIKSQQLKCDYCNTLTDPYSLKKDKDADTDTEFGVTVFRCPQCGGEVMTTDESITGFCSFCGASTVLDARMSSQLRPKKIITFKKTKEDCREIYKNLVNKAIFVPKQLKDPQYIERFRGIYIPYWMYDIAYSGDYAFNGTTTETSLSYIITNHYSLKYNLNIEYTGISYDASASFDDHISESISPFFTANAQEFTPSLLSGFYADTADVSSDVYMADAVAAAQSNVISGLMSEPEFSRYNMSGMGNAIKGTEKLNYPANEPELGLFPVWFLTYRTPNNRVAYAVVNAESGEISSDLPIAIHKYVISSLAVAAGIFALMFFFFTPTPKASLIIAAITAIISVIVYGIEISHIKKRHNKYDDKGFYARYGAETNAEEVRKYGGISGATGSILAFIAAIVVAFIQPVEDWIYYITAIGAIVGVCITMSAIIRRFNILNTRPLPKFHFRKGGDDSAKD